MIRLIGILCGSALAVSFLILALGIPEILPDAVEDVQPEPIVATAISIEPEPVAIEPEPDAIKEAKI